MDLEHPWYCPRCKRWIGYKLDECPDGHRRPHITVTQADVSTERASEVARTERFHAKLRKLLSHF